VTESSPSFLARHQFLIYRLFSLSGLIPVGAFLVVHLLTNASVLSGAGAFQSRVDMIHSLGPLLVPIEWAFIFLPMLFHATVGFLIIAPLQRATGMIAFVFIMGHVIHLHWMGAPLGGGKFDPHAATSSAAVAIHPVLTSILYAIGVLCAVFHLANGLWTLGITWGIWTSPAAMRRANAVSIVVGVLLAVAGLGAIAGLRDIGGDPGKLGQARQVETIMNEDRESRERMLRGEPPARPLAPAVRADEADPGVRPASFGPQTGR